MLERRLRTGVLERCSGTHLPENVVPVRVLVRILFDHTPRTVGTITQVSQRPTSPPRTGDCTHHFSRVTGLPARPSHLRATSDSQASVFEAILSEQMPVYMQRVVARGPSPV